MIAAAMNALPLSGVGAASRATSEPAGRAFRYELMSQDQLTRAIERCPVAYISAGIVEWHGEQSACGLDGLKAESLCWMAADLLGGVCFPHVWYGPDASTPFDPVTYPRGTLTIDKALYHKLAEELLSQIQAMGFRVAVYLSGHYPGVIPEVAKAFNKRGTMKVISVSENQVVQGIPAGDHAATWETAVLWVLRPGLVDLTRLPPLPSTTKLVGDVIPPRWPFHQRSEYYGVYGSDPRIWAGPYFGQRGVEAVIDGLARVVGKALGDATYGRDRRPITWPADSRERPEVRYSYQLPYQWLKRFEDAPIVYLPLPTIGESIDRVARRTVELARQTGGMTFPPFPYGPARDGRRPSASLDTYLAVVKETVLVLADMDFRVIVLMPGAELCAEARHALHGIATRDDQAKVITMDPTDQAQPPAELASAIHSMIPDRPAIRRLVGPWQVTGKRTLMDLRESIYGADKEQAYEHTFELTQAEARLAVLLDLGTVENRCELIVNRTPPLEDHWPPYRFILTGRVKAGANTLKVVVRHEPQPTLDPWYYRVAPPRLKGPVALSLWKP